MITQAFVPKSELFDWLRGAVLRHDSVALEIVTDSQQGLIRLQLSDGRLVYVGSETHGSLGALLVLAESNRVKFSYRSVQAGQHSELMPAEVFLKWLSSEGTSLPERPDAHPLLASSNLDRGRWTGTLRDRTARTGSTAVIGMLLAVVALIAVVGFFVSGAEFNDILGGQQPATDMSTSPPEANRAGGQRISGSIAVPTTWSAGQTYRLDGLVFVENGAQLAIEPGVRVIGGLGAALIVTRDATIHARGSADAPIVFTSAEPDGGRAGGDWGGVVVLGNAPVNVDSASIEGVLPVDDGRTTFGGQDQNSNCGVLAYVRIEFAGAAFDEAGESGGLTLGGCGRETEVHHVQVHRSNGDGIRVLGGATDLRHVFVSHARDDSLDWDLGWAGRAQFLIVQQHPDLGDNGFEGSNWTRQPFARPISRPLIYNVTMVGSRNPGMAQRAIVVEHGSGGEFRNFLIAGFPLEAIDLRGTLTPRHVASNMLSFGSIAMSMIGPDGGSYFTDEVGTDDDDGGFDEQAYFFEIAPDILMNLPEALAPGAFDLVNPDFTPVAAQVEGGSPSLPPDEDFWDQTATYYGAVQYDSQVSWLQGWTASPDN